MRYPGLRFIVACVAMLCCAIAPLQAADSGAGQTPNVAPAARTQTVPAGPSTDWMAKAQEELAQREYHVSENDKGLQAPNRIQGFRTYFDADGIRLVARDVQERSLATIRVAGFGRAGSTKLLGLGPAQVQAQAAQVTQDWPGLRARFDNQALGLCAQWILTRQVEGAGPLTLDLEIGQAQLALVDGAVLLQDTANALRMGAIHAHDANGRSLVVALALTGPRLSLTLDDATAVYPISFTSLIDDQQSTHALRAKSLIDGVANARMESNQANAQLGYSVAGAGDVNGDGFADVIVGANGYDNGQVDEGAAFIYFGGAGLFDPVADAQLEINQAGAQLGISVAGAGDVNGDGFADVIVGAWLFDNVLVDRGAAFVWFGGAGAFDTIADAQLQLSQASAQLGISVAGAGDVNGDGFADVIVGAWGYSNGQVSEGAALLWFGGAGPFEPTVDALLESNQVNAQLGVSVAGAGDVNGDGFADVIVGAYVYDNGQTDEGAAFVYFGGGGVFDTTADALLESNQVAARLGVSVAGAGDVNGDGFADVIVGAYFYDNGQNDEGAAFIWFGGAGAFNTTADALLEVNQVDTRLGLRVAGAGDVNGDGFADVIVGADLYDNGQTDEGAAFVWFGGAEVFDPIADAQLESNQADAQMGWSVAGVGDVNGDGFADVVVGALLFDNGQADEGAAFVYFGGGGRFDANADAQLSSNQDLAQLGFSVAGAGDVNGDGFSDVIVGANGYDNGQAYEGAAFIYFGGAGSFDSTADALLESNQTGSEFGYSVAGAGDVNGDGFADVIVGAYGFTNGQADEGRVFIFFGGAGAFDLNPDGQMESNQADARLGYSVAGAGDLNGDGYADVIAGASLFDSGEADEGAAFIWFGGSGAFDTTVDAQLEPNQPAAGMGISVASAGDVNGDGFGDVIVGAYLYDNGQLDEGAAFIYFGGAGAFNTVADALLELNQAGAFVGFSVGGAGDVNGDGFSDVIVGAVLYANGQTDEGAALIWFGGSGAFNTTLDGLLESDQEFAQFGFSVAGAGDVNGDGFADVAVGARRYDNGQVDEGVVFFYFGRAGSFDTDFDAALESNRAGAEFGISVAGAGDVNGDGFADVIVGAWLYDDGQTDEGAAFVYYGTGGGRLLLAAQYRGNGTSVVSPWGLSQQADGFVVAMEAYSSNGRERARLQVEACPSGARFGLPLCDTRVQSPWTDLGASAQGTTLVLPVVGINNDRLYHWRARLQYAPFGVTQSGIVAAPFPPAGPWRRLQGNADVAEIRTSVQLGLFANGFE